MKKQVSILLVLLVTLLVACQGAEQAGLEAGTAPVEAESVPLETAGAPATQTAETAPTEVIEEEAAGVSGEAPQTSSTGFVSECTLVSSLSEPPQEYAELFAVTEDDWVKGPEDAAITLIEYGDFQ